MFTSFVQGADPFGHIQIIWKYGFRMVNMVELGWAGDMFAGCSARVLHICIGFPEHQ